ncbi:MAG: hypothetical protein QM831_05935 [Kofleriaceae bacterium]
MNRVAFAIAMLVASHVYAAGTHWRLSTQRGPIHVWIPDNYDRDTAMTIVFVHGYNTNVDAAWSDYKLPEQFEHSQLNAMFIACAAPSALNRPVMWSSLTGLLATVVAELGQPLPKGELIAAGHSGAYRTLVHWLGETSLHTLVLLDAAYGEEDQFMEWAKDTSHRLINVASDTVQESNWIAMYLPQMKKMYGLPEAWTDEARAARLLYVRTSVGHMPMITEGVALPRALQVLAK